MKYLQLLLALTATILFAGQRTFKFNLKGGVFFSEELYQKFCELRFHLYQAIRSTQPNGIVDQSRVDDIRNAVYGKDGSSGLATFEKDDLGSYQPVTLQKSSRDG